MIVPQPGFGPGKVILLGEHAVVYGHPALAAPLEWGVVARPLLSDRTSLVVPDEIRGKSRAALKRAFAVAAKRCGSPPVTLFLESDLPVSMGLGSSAAVGVACARSLLLSAGRSAEPEEVARIALEMEKEFHGTPSGVDHTTSAVGQLIEFRRKPGAPAGKARVVSSPKPLKVVIALAGTRPSTRVTVQGLRERAARWPERYERIFQEIGRVALEGARSVEAGDLDALGDAMNVNQGLLSALQLSSSSIEEMVQRLRAAGALGAKLTGAGGDGGAVIGLFANPKRALATLRRQGVHCFDSQVAGPRAK